MRQTTTRPWMTDGCELATPGTPKTRTLAGRAEAIRRTYRRREPGLVMPEESEERRDDRDERHPLRRAGEALGAGERRRI